MSNVFGANKSKNIKDIVEQLIEGGSSICNESVAANVSKEAEMANLCESIKSLMVESYSDAFPEHLQHMLSEDAEGSANLFKNGFHDAYKETLALNENATPSLVSLTASIAVSMRSPYEGVFHRIFDTQTVERPIVSLEEVVPMVIDPAGQEYAIVDAFDPKLSTDNMFIDKTEIILTALTDGIVPGTKNVELTSGMDPLYRVDLAGRRIIKEAEESGAPIASAKVRMKKGTSPYFDMKDNTLSTIFELTLDDGSIVDADVTAKINYQTGVMEYVRADEHITKVYFTGTVSHEEHTHPIQTSFKNTFNEFPIPTRPHIEVSLPNEVRTDIANSINHLSQVDIITKMTEQVSIISSRMEDQRLKKALIDGTHMFEAEFDFEAPATFAHGNLEWVRREFIPFLDQCAVAMKMEYNMEDCHFRIGVSPYILRILDTEYSKDKGLSEEQKGAGAINYSIGVKTSTSVFYLVSSMAMENDRLHMLTIPNNFKESPVKTYNYFKYSSFLTDQLRKSTNSRLPATVYSERNLPMVFTPLSAQIKITNMPINRTSGARFIKKVI